MYEKLGQWLSHRNPPNEPIPAADYFASLPRLTTDRLLLRPLTMRDAADMFAYSRDPEVARHVLWDAHKSMADTRGCLRYIISQYHSGAPSSWGIVLRETNRVVGTIGFMSYSDADSVVELGYSLARSCWNGGLMTEALAAVLRECFTVLRLHRVEAMHECDNPASGRVMENAVCATKGHCAARCSTRAISTTWSCGRCCGRTGTRAIERVSSYLYAGGYANAV